VCAGTTAVSRTSSIYNYTWTAMGLFLKSDLKQVK
jgi:hypothetical protein